MEDIRRRAIDKLDQLLNLREPRREIMWALMGDGEGTLEVPGQAGKVYVMLYGDIDQTVRAWNRVVSPAVGRRVDVEVIREPGMPDDYYVIGLSRIGYGGYGDDPPPGWLIHHAETHERRPGGGSDVVNVYKRALTELRADAQETPDMTLLVSAGFYLTTEIKYFVGGNSPAFGAAPGGAMERYDLLYLNATTSVLAVRAGTAVAPGLAERPQPQENEVPIAWVLLSTETAIIDSMIIDARITVVTMGAHGLVLIHPLDPADGAHSGTLPADEVSNVPAGGIAATDVQAAIDELDAEKAGTHNILDGAWHPDSVTQAVTRGSLIFGNPTSKWDELVIGAGATYLRSDGTDPAYAQIPASEVVNTPAGDIAATDVQAAIDELDAEKASIGEAVATKHIHAYKEDKSEECDGVKVTFITAQQFEPYTLRVFHERLEQVDGAAEDYEEGAMGDSFTMAVAPSGGDKLIMHYLAQRV